MRQMICCMSLVLGIAASAQAAFEHPEIGARAAGLGGAYVALAHDPEGVYWNPAGLASRPSTGASLSYSYPFGLSELSCSSGCVAISSEVGCFSAGVISYGFELYRETGISLSYANALTSGLAVGLSLKVGRLTVEDFGAGHAFALDLGFLAEVTERFQWGVTAWNMVGTRIGDEPLGQTLTLGAAFHPVEHLTLCVDTRKSLDRSLQIRVGAEYELMDSVTLRAGAGDAPTRFSSGIGIHRGPWRLDYTVCTHLVLGLSHQVSLHIVWKNR